MEEQKQKPSLVKMLTNQSFTFSVCITVLGCVAMVVGYKEGAVAAISGLAGMMQQQRGED